INARNTITSPPEDVLQILKQCDSLVDLSMSTSWPPSMNANISTTPTLLPNLRVLKLCTDGSNSSPLLRQMTLPALVSLQVFHISSSCTTEKETTPYSFIKDLVSRSCCAIDYLSITDKSITEHDL